MSSSLENILDEAQRTAIEAAILASKHVLDYWPNPLNVHFKKDLILEIFDKTQGMGNYATIADTASENLILKKIKDNPILINHNILAEESEAIEADSPFQWVIDPIDGTLNFRNGMSDFGIAIGLLYKKQPTLGVIAMPALKQLLVARKGEGAQLLSFDLEPLYDLTTIEYTEPITKALIAFDTGYENRAEQYKATAEKIADKVGYPVSYASASAANYKITMGHVAAYIHPTPTKYDIAAATVIITEAGGVVTDIQGKPIDWSAPQVSYLGARNSEIHKKLLELLTD